MTYDIPEPFRREFASFDGEAVLFEYAAGDYTPGSDAERAYFETVAVPRGLAVPKLGPIKKGKDQ